MWFVVIGVLMVILNLAGIGPTAEWTWDIGFQDGAIQGDLWKFLLPFILAVVWWTWSDASGLTHKREMLKDEDRKAERRRKNVEALGLGPKEGSQRGARRR